MLQLAIPIPNIKGKQDIEIEMTVNGQRQKMHFVVEVYRWDECTTDSDNRIECIKQLVNDYGNEWMIYHIGMPTEEYVPLTFVNAQDWARQRQLMMSTLNDSQVN